MYEDEIHFRNCCLNGLGTFDLGDIDLWPCDPSINRVSLLPKMDVCTKFEGGRSRKKEIRKVLTIKDQYWNMDQMYVRDFDINIPYSKYGDTYEKEDIITKWSLILHVSLISITWIIWSLIHVNVQTYNTTNTLLFQEATHLTRQSSIRTSNKRKQYTQKLKTHYMYQQ